MNSGIALSLHFWRGFGGDTQRDLFFWRRRFGFVTIAIERTDVLVAYRKVRSASLKVVEAIARADEEER